MRGKPLLLLLGFHEGVITFDTDSRFVSHGRFEFIADSRVRPRRFRDRGGFGDSAISRPAAVAFLRLAGPAAASTLAPMRRKIILAAALVLAQAMSGVAAESAQVNRERVNPHF